MDYTVKDLKEKLKDFDDNVKVVFPDLEPVVNVVYIEDNNNEYCVITDRSV